ncbi:HET-domain-containing protein, partial [Thozetella sp. PMI_491]
MTSRSPDGIYLPLDKESHEIRLLEIDPISNGSYQLRVVSLRDGPPPIFAALSYVWGDPLPTAELVVSGQKVTVRSSLAGALANASSHWETWSAQFPERCLGTCRLWADALCIDQENTDEKNHQVSQMAEVYRKAELVICWLGPSNDQIFLAMDSIQIIAQEASTSDLTTDAINSMMGLSYWTRVWIFQEVVLGRHCL